MVQSGITDASVDAVRDSVHFMRDYAQQIAPVRTGAYRASLYVNGPMGESDYAQAVAHAKELNPPAGILPELQAAQWDPNASRLRNNMGQFSLPEALMGSAVVYSLYLEEGTVHMAPRPTIRQASLVAAERFKQLMAHVADAFV